MTRRAAAGLARLLPLLLIAAAVVVVTGAALIAACGGSAGGAAPEPTTTATAPADGTTEPTAAPTVEPSPTPPPSSDKSTLRLYFLRDGLLGVAERRVAHTSAIATASLKELLSGPSAAEQAAGLGTAIPAGTKLLALSIDHGAAAVDLSDEFGGADAAAAAEVVFTLTRFPTVRRVVLTVHGVTFAPSGSAGPGDKGWTRADFADLQPSIFVETPGAGAVLSSPFALTGTASVFEGSFQARLVDSSGRRIVNVIMQASEGAPGRGRFAKEVPYSTAARRGTLIVFDQSMEDGSRQDEVRIPVSFAAD